MQRYQAFIGTLFFTLGAAVVLAGTSPAQAGSEAYLRSTIGQPWGVNTNENAMNTVFGAGNWSDLRYESVNPVTLFAPSTDFIFMEGGDSNANALNSFLTTNTSAIQNWVNAGGSLFVNAAPNVGGNINLGFGATLVYPDFNGTAHAVNPLHPIFNGPFGATGTAFTGGYFSHAVVNDPGLTPLILGGDGGTVLGEEDFGAGHLLFGGMTTTNFQNPQPNATILRENILAYGDQQANLSPAPAPEPTSLALLATGGLPLLGFRRRRKTA